LEIPAHQVDARFFLREDQGDVPPDDGGLRGAEEAHPEDDRLEEQRRGKSDDRELHDGRRRKLRFRRQVQFSGRRQQLLPTDGKRAARGRPGQGNGSHDRLVLAEGKSIFFPDLAFFKLISAANFILYAILFNEIAFFSTGILKW